MTLFIAVCEDMTDDEGVARLDFDTNDEDDIDNEVSGDNDDDGDPLSVNIFCSVYDGDAESERVGVMVIVADGDLLNRADVDTLLLTTELLETLGDGDINADFVTDFVTTALTETERLTGGEAEIDTVRVFNNGNDPVGAIVDDPYTDNVIIDVPVEVIE